MATTVTIDDAEVQALLRQWVGEKRRRRMENAALEMAAQIDARARRYAHVLTANMQGSIFHHLGGEDAEALATVGASASYSAIEDLRGTGIRWDEDVPWDAAGSGAHSFMSRAVKETIPTMPDIFGRWLDPDTQV